MRASLSWMSWNSPMGWPNWTRSLAYWTDRSRHSSMMPRAMAATPERSMHERGLGALAAARGDVLGLADQAVDADPHVVEEQLAGGRRVHAHLAQRLGLLEAGHALVEDEGEHLALGGRRCPRRACR